MLNDFNKFSPRAFFCRTVTTFYRKSVWLFYIKNFCLPLGIRFGLADHCVRSQTIFTYLLTLFISSLAISLVTIIPTFSDRFQMIMTVLSQFVCNVL